MVIYHWEDDIPPDQVKSKESKLDSSWLDNPTEFYLRMGSSPQVFQNGISILNEHTGFESV